jgi:hypothetical protein
MSTTEKPTVRDSSSVSDGAAASKPQVAPASPAGSTLAPSRHDPRARRWMLFSGPRSDARRERYRHEVLDVADGARKTKRLDGEKGALPDGAPSAQAESTGLERTMGWKGCAWNSCAYSIALGILSLVSEAPPVSEAQPLIIDASHRCAPRLASLRSSFSPASLRLSHTTRVSLAPGHDAGRVLTR